MLSAESSARARTPSGRISYARIDRKVDGISYEKFEIPNLIELQLDSFAWFVDKGLRELFDEISPIKDFTGKVMELQFLDYEFGAPKYTEDECRTKDLTFSKPLYVNVELLIKETGEIQRQRVYMGDFPSMTDQGTFVINGAERVVVSQLVRSPGVYYSEIEDPDLGPRCCSAPRSSRTAAPGSSSRPTTRTSCGSRSIASARSRRRPCSAPSATSTNDEIAALFTGVDIDLDHQYISEHARQGPDPHPGRTPSSRSTRSCARAIRPPATTPASWSRACSSTSAATTSAASAATSSTRSWTRSRRASASSCRVTAGPSPARTSRRSSATSSSATAGSTPRTTSTTSATAASAPTAS